MQCTFLNGYLPNLAEQNKGSKDLSKAAAHTGHVLLNPAGQLIVEKGGGGGGGGGRTGGRYFPGAAHEGIVRVIGAGNITIVKPAAN